MLRLHQRPFRIVPTWPQLVCDELLLQKPRRLLLPSKLWLVGLQLHQLHNARERQIMPKRHLQSSRHHGIFALSHNFESWGGSRLQISDHGRCDVRVAFPHHLETVCPTGEMGSRLPTPNRHWRMTMMQRPSHPLKPDGVPRVHGPRLYVCQAPNAFICVSSVAPPKHQMRLYVCHQMRLYVCHQMRLYVCHQMRLYVCHQMCLLTQRSSLRSLTFARFARTFFNSLN